MREIETLRQIIAKLKSEARLAEGKLAAKFGREFPSVLPEPVVPIYLLKVFKC